MRIVLASWQREIAGGAERHLQSLIPELLKRGHDVAVVHGYDVGPDQPTIDPPEARLTTWSVDRLGLTAALQAIEDWRPSLIYSHGSGSADLDAALVTRYP